MVRQKFVHDLKFYVSWSGFKSQKCSYNKCIVRGLLKRYKRGEVSLVKIGAVFYP